MAGGGGRSAAREARRAREAEEARQARIREGTDRIESIFSENFGDSYFADQRQAYLDYATPQIDRQFRDASEQTTFNLARGGLLDSSVRAGQEADLQGEFDDAMRQTTDASLDYEMQARNSVEAARGNLIRTLTATADADQAASSAMQQAAALSKPAPYSPIAQITLDAGQTLSRQLAFERANQTYGAPAPRYDTGLYRALSGGSRDVQVRR